MRTTATREAMRHDETQPAMPSPQVALVHQPDPSLGNQYAEQASQLGLCLQRSVDGSCSGCCGACQSDERSDGIQPSLAVSAPNDPLEVEADRIANLVVQRAEDEDTASEPEGGNPIIAQIEQLTAEDGRISRKASGLSPAATQGVATALDSTHGLGAPLPGMVRRQMENAFAADFGNVRLHTDGQAATMSRQLRAHAFTQGNDIYFNSGKFDPGSHDGKHLLAHELAHTIQQRDGRQPIQRLTITRNSFTRLDCGGREVRWTFTLDAAAPTDGYIVQRVRMLETIQGCPSSVASISLTPVSEFWEAWKVRAGATREQAHASFGFTDASTRPPEPDKSGCQATLGQVKFFPIATTGDLGSDGVAPATPASAWGPGRVPTSGGLPSTATQPSWWTNTPGEGPANRWASSWWNCCRSWWDPFGRNKFSEVDTHP